MWLQRWYYRVRTGLRTLFRRWRVEDELAAELRDHLERETEHQMTTRGVSQTEARRRAGASLQAVQAVKERCREVWRFRWLDDLGSDLRFGVRGLARNPGFTATAVLSLALGVGATVAIFSLLDRVLLRPLPVTDPSELANVYTSCRRGNPYCATSFPEFLDYRSQSRTFTDLASFQPMTLSASAGTGSWVSDAMLITDNYFTLLGVTPFTGRLITPGMNPEADPVVVLSHDVWTSRFGRSPNVLGDSVQLNGTAFRVIGIAPPAFRGTRIGSRPELWVPIESRSVWARAQGNPDLLTRRGTRWISGTIGRRRPGVTIEQAQAEMDVISDGLESTDTSRSGRFITVEPAGTLTLPAGSADDIVRFIGLLMAGVAATLFIACANIAGLLLARGAARRREVELRRALGAGRARLVRQLVTEYLVLVVAGTATGLVVARSAMTALAAYELPGAVAIASLDLGLDPRVLTFAIVLMVMTGLFGLLPAFGTAAVKAAHTMSERATGEGTGTSIRGHGLLLTVQVAITIVLLFGAGLFIRSLRNGLGLDVGLNSRHVAIASITPSLARYSPERTRAVIDEAATRLVSLPGIESAAFSLFAPLAPAGMGSFAEIDGYAPAPGEEVRIESTFIGPEYFQTLGIEVLAGRGLTASDREGAPLVAVINETMARRYWSDRNPIGGRVRIGDGTVDVVGVVGDVTAGLVGAQEPFVYLPADQNWARIGAPPFPIVLLAKGDSPDVPLVTSMRTLLREIDPAVPLLQVTTLEARMTDLLMPQRMGSVLMSALASLTAILVVIGIVGSVSYGVSRRRREIGIRLALGAHPVHVAGVMTRSTIVPVCLGLLAGLTAALALGRFVTSFLYGIAPTDGLTLLAALVVLSGLAGLAAYCPAHRATRGNPMDVLREA